MTEKRELIVGIWKFHERVPLDQLTAVAEKWAEDDCYQQLYIRKVSKDQYGIGFTYQAAGTVTDEVAQRVHDDYRERTSDQLRRSFGNDLVGWDISSPAWIVK